MKPTVEDATHYNTTRDVWYKIGESTVFFWNRPTDGWIISLYTLQEINPPLGFITAQEALERGYKYPTTAEVEIADSRGAGEVLGAYTPLTPDMTEASDRKQPSTSIPVGANSRQVGGDHYKKMKIQPWDLFSSIFNLDEQIGFYLGNVYKYLMRYDSKNGVEDLMKAKHYLEKLIEVKRGAADADALGKR